MNIYISYFGQMRNLPSNMLPVSTAKWDAQWFKGQIKRIDDLVMPDEYVVDLERNNEMCRKDCPLVAPCSFMKKYREYLDTLDFNHIIMKLNLMLLDSKADTIVLMVYEKTEVKCAERPVLQAWFKDNGMELPEWKKVTGKRIVSLF